jgi:hypothetical protein
MRLTRRGALASAGLALSGVAGCLGEGSAYENGWDRADSDTDDALQGVAALENDDALAVGLDGTVVKRIQEGEWREQAGAPGTQDETHLYTAAPTADFGRVWYAGDDGLVGMYDSHGDFDSHSQPLDRTKRFVDVTVDGSAGGEEVYLVDDEGNVLRGSENKQGEVTWDMGKRPGRGQPLAITFTTDNFGYLCTDTGEAFQNVGQGWEGIGIDGVRDGLTDVSGHEESLLDVASSKGKIYRYNGYDWRVIELGEHPIDAMHRTGRHGLAVSSDGVVYALNRSWEQSLDGLPEGLNGATTGTENGDVFCVGNNGFLIYRSK